MGTLTVEPGFYVYVGSALGPGGIAARVTRHLREEKSLRWHIDFLRAVTSVTEVWYAVGGEKRECQWAEAISRTRHVTRPMDGFGSSDCDCPSHLFLFRHRPKLSAV